MGVKIEKSHGSRPPGLRGGAGAEERSRRANGGRNGAPRARRCAPVRFFNFTTHRVKIVKLLSKTVQDTLVNSPYSAKNDVAIL